MKNKKVFLVGPIDTKGRYVGGIAYIINALLTKTDLFTNNSVELVPVDTCGIERDSTSAGKISIANIINTLHVAINIKKRVANEKPEIVYYNTSRKYALLKDLLILKLIGKHSDTRNIVHIHFADLNAMFPKQTILRKVCFVLIRKYVDHLVLLSEKTKMDFVKLGFDETKISVIYNFHQLDFSENEILKKANEANCKKKKDVVFIGSLDARKGVVDLMNAFRMCPESVTLHLCGQFTNEEVRNEVERIAEHLPVGSVVFHGYVNSEEKRSILEKCDAMILPSYGEGFPIVLVEGLAAGCLIIATNVGAIPEVFGNNTGIILEPGDIEGLKKAMVTVSKLEDIETTMVSNWRLGSQFGIKEFILSMCKVCKQV